MQTRVWHSDQVKSFQDIDYFFRTTSMGKASLKRIALSLISGTNSSFYHKTEIGTEAFNKITWLEMLQQLPRATEECRAWYTDYHDPDRVYLGMSLAQYGNDFLIDQGNNRLCTWKFAEKESALIKVQEYTYDSELCFAYKYLLSQNIGVTRLDEYQEKPQGHWTLQLNKLKVICQNRQEVLSFVDGYTAMSVKSLAWFKLWLRCKHWPQLRDENRVLYWNAYLTNTAWFIRDFKPYLLAYKIRQEFTTRSQL